MNEIPQFRNTISDVRHHAQYGGWDEDTQEPIIDKLAKFPTLTFTGTVKLHGTNASVCYDGENLWAQSKENVLTVEKDNYGFAFFVETNKEYFLKEMKELIQIDKSVEIGTVCIYGEWAGKGIQSGVAINNIEKTFFMFGIKFKVKGEEDFRWAVAPEVVLNHITNGQRIRSIYEFPFPIYEIEVDFENPAPAQNKMLKIVDEIDAECPIGKFFGHEGHGEGIVWIAHYKENRYIFKTKGENHSKSKVKTLKPVDEVKEQAKIDFANYVCTADRLMQAWEKTFQVGGDEIIPTVKMTGDFLRAVIKDVMKEEMDILAEKGLEPKEVNGMISKVARIWFMEQLDKEAGL